MRACFWWKSNELIKLPMGAVQGASWLISCVGSRKSFVAPRPTTIYSTPCVLLLPLFLFCAFEASFESCLPYQKGRLFDASVWINKWGYAARSRTHAQPAASQSSALSRDSRIIHRVHKIHCFAIKKGSLNYAWGRRCWTAEWESWPVWAFANTHTPKDCHQEREKKRVRSPRVKFGMSEWASRVFFRCLNLSLIP